MKNSIAKVAVSSAVFAIDKPYDYKIPDNLEGKILPGMRVVVPFGRGNKSCEAIVLSVADESGFEKIKCIDSIMDDEPVLSPEMIKLALWMRDRFFCTVYDAVHAMLPSGMWYREGETPVKEKTVRYVHLNVDGEEARAIAGQKSLSARMQSAVLKLLSAVGGGEVREICYLTGASIPTINALEKQGLITTEYVEVFRRPEYTSADEGEPISLNDEQETCFNKALSLMRSGRAEAALLFGITGSGKTSVYIRLIQEALQDGRGAIVLVPEIGLTPQFVSIFSSYFGDSVAVLHSSLSMGERYDEWRRIRSGAVKMVIGTRSAVFAPLPDIGLIIIDEEQEYTYKSENAPRYHARDVAKYRCVQSNALLLLGSATPSIESMHSAKAGKYELLTLSRRYNERGLPKVLIADMREEIRAGNMSSVSSVLHRELKKNIAAGEQSILFINRRGASSLVVCGECGYTFGCVNCSVSMTFHSVNRRLMCHHCGHSFPQPEDCPDCGGRLKYVGAGTQKVQEELSELFPDIEILRMDTDTVSRLNSHDKILSRFRDRKIPVLVGTQMVTKGLDFENVTLVGVISADQSLYTSDYRAHERTFSLITQVVGRSGRGDKEGRAVIQTFTPSNEVINLASRQDYMSFFDREIDMRYILGTPPAADIFVFTVSGAEEAEVLRGCVKLRDSLKKLLVDAEDIRILGPAPAYIVRLNNRFRYRLSVSCANTRRLRELIAHLLREFSKDRQNRGVSAFADINPFDL